MGPVSVTGDSLGGSQQVCGGPDGGGVGGGQQTLEDRAGLLEVRPVSRLRGRKSVTSVMLFV